MKQFFACVIGLVLGFALGMWFYSERIAVLRARVELAKEKAAYCEQRGSARAN
jgi:hypothetical protein